MRVKQHNGQIMSFPGNWKISATRIMTSVLYTFLVTQNFSIFYNAAKFNTEHFSPLIMCDLALSITANEAMESRLLSNHFWHSLICQLKYNTKNWLQFKMLRLYCQVTWKYMYYLRIPWVWCHQNYEIGIVKEKRRPDLMVLQAFRTNH